VSLAVPISSPVRRAWLSLRSVGRAGSGAGGYDAATRPHTGAETTKAKEQMRRGLQKKIAHDSQRAEPVTSRKASRPWRPANYAGKGVAACPPERKPPAMDTLTWAYFLKGETSKAVDLQKEELQLLPTGPSTDGMTAIGRTSCAE
jgi:hypothetical protein